MNPNSSGPTVEEDTLNESNLTQIGMDWKQMGEKIQKLEDLLMKMANDKNNGEQFAAAMMQKAFQFGKELGELKERIKRFEKEFGKLKEENAPEMCLNQRELGGMKKAFAELNATKDGNRAFDELKEEMAEKDRKLNEIEKELAELKAQIVSEKNNAELEEDCDDCDVGRIVKEKDAELQQKLLDLNEDVKETLNTIMQRQKTIKFNNGINECRPGLSISDDGLTVTHTGHWQYQNWNTVRSCSSIPLFNSYSSNSYASKPTIRFYFEVEILNKIGRDSICIEFYCGGSSSYTLDRYLEYKEKSFGINWKGGMWIDGRWTRFENVYGHFKNGDVIGLGIVHFPYGTPIEFFSTCNGQLLGKLKLPDKLGSHQLQVHPAVTLGFKDESIRANFGKEEWQFKQFGQLLL